MIMNVEQYEQVQCFRQQSADLLYDFYYPHKLDQPASCCSWVSPSTRMCSLF